MDPPFDELRASLGAAVVLSPGDGLDAYEIPARGQRGSAAAVVRPAEVAEVRELLGWARAHRVRVIAQGANTGLVGASTPALDHDEPQVVLSTERLRPPLDIDPVDRIAVVGAGTRLSELNDAAAAHGLHLPIDLGADPSLGGMVATNTGGSRVLAYGDMRRQVLGLRCVVPDDELDVVDELRALRKDNTGAALWPLLIGAGGAFAVITDVAVELTPLPEERVTAWLVPRDSARLPTMLVELERRLPEVTAFEVLSSAALAAVTDLDGSPPVPDLASAGVGHVALVEASGRDGVEDRLITAVADLPAHIAPLDAVVAPETHTWGVRHRVTEALAHAGVVVGADVSVPRSRVAVLVRSVGAVVADRWPEATFADFGHWGDGGVHCNVVLPRGAGPDQVGAVREAIFDVVAAHDGSFSAEHGIGPANAARWRSSVPPSRRRVLASLAATLDPSGILGHPGLPYRTA